MKSKVRHNSILIFVAALSLCFCFAFFAVDNNIALAVVPQNYQETVSSLDKDWWAGSDFIDLESLKEIVASWFDNPLYRFTGVETNPVVVAVIDSGINFNHQIFTGVYDENGAPPALSDTFNNPSGLGEYDVLYRSKDGKIIGKNTVPSTYYQYSSTDIADDTAHAHGSHVAGIIALLIHELNLEKYIKIMPIKAGYPKGTNATFELAAVTSALDYAMSNGADVVNMSFESDKKSFDVVSDDMAQKAIFVAAAGNSGKSSSSQKIYPAAGKNVIGVMNIACDGNGEAYMADKSNYGSVYDICAPGADIFSVRQSSNDNYINRTGTSMAAPFVSFGAALTLLKYRAIEEATRVGKSIAEITDLVKHSSDSVVSYKGADYPIFDVRMLAAGNDSHYARIDVMSGGADSAQSIDDVRAVNMQLIMLPSHTDGASSITWYANGEKFAEGVEATYLPPSALGTTQITAVWTYVNDDGDSESTVAKLDLVVEYFRATRENISTIKIAASGKNGSIVNLAKGAVGEEYIFTLNKGDYLDPKIAMQIIWYVNGASSGVIGKSFDFTPEQEGSYQIQARIGSNYTAPITLVVKKGLPRSTKIIIIVSAVAAAIIIAIAITIVIIATTRRRKKIA